MYLYLFVVVSWTVTFLLSMRGSRGVSKVGDDKKEMITQRMQPRETYASLQIYFWIALSYKSYS